MTIVIDKKWCKGCGICVHFCPKKVLAMSEERSASGYRAPCVADAEKCIGCRMCERLCPDLCIDVQDKTED